MDVHVMPYHTARADDDHRCLCHCSEERVHITRKPGETHHRATVIFCTPTEVPDLQNHVNSVKYGDVGDSPPLLFSL